MHGRDGFQRLPVQQHQVTTVGRPVVDETHRHAVVLGGVRCGRYEDELAGLATGPERDGLGPPAGEVVPEDRVGRGKSRRSGGVADRVPVPVLPADQPLVDARVLLGRVIEALFDNLPGGKVDRPPVQRPVAREPGWARW